ncbi:uncharacterized protein LOC122059480 [Macadamia integrifolia]|uniref:uncharacterized protein LOC122059480 n=1 Tax=Macadamia integrifolia TaxID=60698 RepID=UPI001C52B653|nr:uncharacterized protein LOC122059480 [Macadamia integrifolia]
MSGGCKFLNKIKSNQTKPRLNFIWAESLYVNNEPDIGMCRLFHKISGQYKPPRSLFLFLLFHILSSKPITFHCYFPFLSAISTVFVFASSVTIQFSTTPKRKREVRSPSIDHSHFLLFLWHRVQEKANFVQFYPQAREMEGSENDEKVAPNCWQCRGDLEGCTLLCFREGRMTGRKCQIERANGGQANCCCN